MRGKHFFHQPAKLTCAAYHAPSRLLCAGFAHGVFTLHRVGPGTFEHAQTLSISREKVSAVTFNASGDWIALGCERLGQLVVWEWQSEAYVHKQQGHYFDVNRCAYAPDGSMIATAADDHKVKVWSASTGSCFVTFAEHSGPVSAVAFLPSGHAVLSASLDGTVSAFHDLMRYRNFRVLTSPDPCQFCSLAVDPSGEVVCAGTRRASARSPRRERRRFSSGSSPPPFLERLLAPPRRASPGFIFFRHPARVARRRESSPPGGKGMIVTKSNADVQ